MYWTSDWSLLYNFPRFPRFPRLPRAPWKAMKLCRRHKLRTGLCMDMGPQSLKFLVAWTYLPLPNVICNDM